MKRFDYFIGAVAIVAFFMLIAELSGYLDRYEAVFKLANLVVLALFLIHVAVSFILSPSKLAHIKHNWLDFIVFIPLVQLYQGLEDTPAAVIVRQVVIVFMVISRTRKANKLVSLLGLKPAQLMLTSFAAAICIGTVLLMLPAATVSGVRTNLVDALYTATSATCVTGLIVKDTAVYFSRFGQCVILALIQIGALGIMTFSVSLAVIARKRVEMQRQIEMQEMLDQDTISSIKDLLKFIVRMAFAFELAGAVGLFFAWRGKIGADGVTAFHAAFHSISAFCNAGFSTFSDSLVRFAGDIPTNAVIVLLIIFGGLGFTVVRDITANVRDRAFRRSPRILSLRVQTKIVLTVSVALIVAGALLFYALERDSLLAGAGIKNGILLSLFQSVTARTAGFNTCDFGALSSATLMVVIVLMFIGASPGSTGGGIKTTTIAVLWSAVLSGLRKRTDAELYRRTIPVEVIQKALSLLVISLVVVLTFGLILLYFEKLPFASVLFETVSAFGTVGLSTGVSAQFTTAGKIAVTLLMFTGRLGPLTIAYAFLRRRTPGQYRYAEERIMIG